MKPWFTAGDASSAPWTNLTLLAQLRGFHHTVGRIAAKKLEGHLWYLSPELVSLALCDDLVPSNTKRAMVSAMQKQDDHMPRKVEVKNSSNIGKLD